MLVQSRICNKIEWMVLEQWAQAPCVFHVYLHINMDETTKTRPLARSKKLGSFTWARARNFTFLQRGPFLHLYKIETETDSDRWCQSNCCWGLVFYVRLHINKGVTTKNGPRAPNSHGRSHGHLK
jgi:hypothetical protein